jgi:hypothetical protein
MNNEFKLVIDMSARRLFSRGGKNLLCAYKATKKILFFPKKPKNILFLAGLGRLGGGGGQKPPCPPLRTPMVIESNFHVQKFI